MLELLHISKKLNNNLILNDCTFSVPDGQIYGIVGINGVGKSTLLKIISGVYKQNSGTILFNNSTILNNNLVKKDILFIPDNLSFYFYTKIKDIFEYYNVFYKINRKYLESLCTKFELNINDKIIDLSKGTRKRVFIVLALAIAPKLLLLDETFDGLDPKAKHLFKEELLKLKETKNITVILTSHSIRELNDIVDAILYLKEGTILNINDFTYHSEPIYRVISSLDINNLDLNALNILRKEKNNNLNILDIYSNKESIDNIFNVKDSIYSLDLISFEDWIVYQMEVIA